MRQGRAAWEKMFPEEPFEADPSWEKKAGNFVLKSSYDVAAAMGRQRNFLYQATLLSHVQSLYISILSLS